MDTFFRIILFVPLFASYSILCVAQEQNDLFETITIMDSMYTSALNDCDVDLYESYLSEDFEFFHDKGGFTESREAEMSNMAMFCGEQRIRQPLRRELIEGSLQVFPMDNYGALEFADHVFYLQINDGTEKLVGQAKMTALWQYDNAQWKLTRIISYNHQPLAEVELEDEVLERYVGDYVLPDRIVNIVKEGKLLRVTDINNGEQGWTKELFPESEKVFYLNYENVQFEFSGDESSIEKLTIYENGVVIEEGIRKVG